MRITVAIVFWVIFIFGIIILMVKARKRLALQRLDKKEDPTKEIEIPKETDDSKSSKENLEKSFTWNQWLEGQRKKWWWRENEFFVIIGIISIHWTIYLVWPEWYVANIWTNGKIWCLEIIMIFHAMMIPKGEGPLHHKLGKIMVPISLVAMIIIWIWNPTGGQAKMTQPPTQSQPQMGKSNPFAKVHPVPTHNVADEEPGAMMVLREKAKYQPDLLERCIEESGGRQHTKVGGAFTTTVIHGIAEDGKETSSVGICQINENANGKFCKDLTFDIMQAGGNVDCALALYYHNHQGLAPWYTDPRSPDALPFTVVVEKGHPVHLILPTVKPLLVKNSSFDFNHTGKLVAGGITYGIGPGVTKYTVPASVTDLEFSTDGETTTSPMLYTYWPRS